MENKAESSWPNIENFEKLKLEEVKFIFEQAEKQLKETSDVSSLLISRTTTLVTLITGLMVGVIGYGIGKWQSNPGWNEILITSIVAVFYLFMAIVLLALNIKGADFYTLGTEPKFLFVEHFFDENKVPQDKRIIHFFVNEMVICQKKIENNKEVNDKRWKRFHTSLFMMIVFPSLLLVTYFLVTLLD